MSYHLKNGNLEFEVGKKEQSILEGAMYWSFEKETAEKTGDKQTKRRKATCDFSP